MPGGAYVGGGRREGVKYEPTPEIKIIKLYQNMLLEHLSSKDVIFRHIERCFSFSYGKSASKICHFYSETTCRYALYL